MPIDPDYPTKRLEYILEDSKASIVLTQESLVGQLPRFAGQTICLDGDWAEIGCGSEENPVTEARPEHLAYVLFTSGSTGRPKGVALEHRAAATFVQWAKQVFTPQELAAVLFSTSVCFDLSVFEIFVTLSTGGRIILARNALHQEGKQIRNFTTAVFDLNQIVNYATPGYATAVMVTAQGVERVRTTAESHRRIAIVEVMGRDSGHIALGTAYGQPVGTGPAKC